MDKLKNVCSISLYNLKKWPTNPRTYVVFLMIFLYLHSILLPIATFCANSGYGITPFLFPFVMSEPISITIIMLGLVLLLCDAPFIEIDQPYIIIRAGRRIWALGQVVYILTVCFIYFFAIQFFLIILMLPYTEFSFDWGKVISTFAQTEIATQHSIFIPFPFIIFNAYSPFQALSISFFNSCLIAFILGLLIFVLNHCFSRFTGVFGAVLLILWQTAVTKTWTGFTKFSPVTWVALSRIDINDSTLYPSLKFVYIAISLIISILFASCLYSVKKQNIEAIKFT